MAVTGNGIDAPLFSGKVNFFRSTYEVIPRNETSSPYENQYVPANAPVFVPFLLRKKVKQKKKRRAMQLQSCRLALED